MVTLNLGQTTASNLSDRVEAVTVPSKEMDSPMEQQETTWTNTKASQYWGYFNSVADLKSALLLKSVWTVGKGYEVEPADQIILDHLRGCLRRNNKGGEWDNHQLEAVEFCFNAARCKQAGADYQV